MYNKKELSEKECMYFKSILLLCGAPIEEEGFCFKSMHIVSVLLQRIVFLEVFVSVIRLNKSFGVNHIVAPKVVSKYACGRGIFFFLGSPYLLLKKSCLRGSFLWGKFSMLLLIRRKVADLWKKLAHLKYAHLWKSAHLIVPIFEKSAHLMVLIDEQKQIGNSNYCARECSHMIGRTKIAQRKRENIPKL